MAGCRSQLADPHGFNTAHEVDQMAKFGRTLLMVREASHASSASLACYQSTAAPSYAHGIAINDTGDLSATVVKQRRSSSAPRSRARRAPARRRRPSRSPTGA